MISHNQISGRLSFIARLLEKEKNNSVRFVFLLLCLLFLIPSFFLTFINERIGLTSALLSLWIGVPFAYSMTVKIFKLKEK